MSTQVTLVLPSYNEGKRIAVCLEDLFQVWSHAPFSWELVIVDDGSKQEHLVKTREIVSEFQKKFSNASIKLIELPINQGKGGALQAGFESSTAEYVGFLDADGATSATTALKAAAHLFYSSNTVDAVIGSRIKMLGRHVERKFSRHLIGRFFATLVSELFQVPIYDSQCGCKFFKREEVMPLLKLILDSRWTWDTQLLLLLYILQSRIEEFPIDWHEVEGSKVHVFRDSWRMFKNLSRFYKAYYQNREWIKDFRETKILPESIKKAA